MKGWNELHSYAKENTFENLLQEINWMYINLNKPHGQKTIKVTLKSIENNFYYLQNISYFALLYE